MINENLKRYLKSELKELGVKKIKEDVVILKDLKGREFYFMTGENEGYLIYDLRSGHIIERSESFKIPYNDLQDKYYFGPLNYYVKENGNFTHLNKGCGKIGKEDAKILQENLDSILNNMLLEPNISVLNYVNGVLTGETLQLPKSKKVYIRNYEKIKYANFPSNWDGSCSFVAGALMMYYWYATGNEKLIPSNYINSKNNMLIDTGKRYDPNTNLKDKLVQLNGGETSSWGKPLKESIKKFCKQINFKEKSHYYIGKLNLTNEIKAGRPVVFFGLFPPDPVAYSEARGKISHGVIVYGYVYNFWSNSFICHYGWDGWNYQEVILSTYVEGSITTFKPL
ncbi:putative cysteine peptidase [Mesoplasma coleopterae]|uniref:putative cysteine peptidase n=1 Tax=Mesoplasma coleopterae TaxID=324078 RepID=UPI000D027F77|nr:hypothetical protein [Mesoplasma coleopterae]AVN63110.1 hypothetical protein CG000_02245 [Mesoplasma coleopterae]